MPNGKAIVETAVAECPAGREKTFGAAAGDMNVCVDAIFPIRAGCLPSARRFGESRSAGPSAAESINGRLSSLGIRWIRVCYIDNPATGCYEVTLELDTNTTGSERSVGFGTSTCHLLLRQRPQNSYPTVEWPADRCYRICPGQPAEILLHDTEFDKSYFIWRTYEDDADEEMDSALGTGGDCLYTGIGTPGTYRFDFPNSDFSVRYYEAFDYVYNAGEEVLTADPDGGVYRYALTRYWKNGTMYSVDDLADISFFDAPFAVYNSGGSLYWNPHMRISYGYDDSEGSLYLEISSSRWTVFGEVTHVKRVGAQGVVARGVVRQGKILGVDAVASEDLDAAYEYSTVVE